MVTTNGRCLTMEEAFGDSKDLILCQPRHMVQHPFRTSVNQTAAYQSRRAPRFGQFALNDESLFLIITMNKLVKRFPTVRVPDCLRRTGEVSFAEFFRCVKRWGSTIFALLFSRFCWKSCFPFACFLPLCPSNSGWLVPSACTPIVAARESAERSRNHDHAGPGSRLLWFLCSPQTLEHTLRGFEHRAHHCGPCHCRQ